MSRTIQPAVLTEAQKSANQPIYLFKLELDGNTLYYTDNNESVNFPTSGGHTYVPRGVSFNPVKTTTSGEYDRTKVRFDNVDLALTTLLGAYTFQGRVLTIMRVFYNLLTDSANTVIIFSGEMGRPVVTGSTFEIEVKSWRAKLQHETGRLFAIPCPYTFDGVDCLGGKEYTASTISFVDGGAGFDWINDTASGFSGIADMEVTVSGSTSNDGTYTVLAIYSDKLVVATGTLTAESAGASVTITASLARETTGTLTSGSDANDLYDTGRVEADDYWNYGTIEMTSGAADGLKEVVKLFENTGGHIEPLHPFDETPSAGDTYKIRRGCPKTVKACKAYANYVNYGGFPQMPRDNILE